MNVLMIRPDAVLVERDEIPIQKMFESLGIKCIKVHCSILVGVSTLCLLYRLQFDMQIHLGADSTAGQLMFVAVEN